MSNNNLEIIKIKSQYIPIIEMRNYLSKEMGISLKSKVLKADLVKVFLENVSEDNSEDIITAFTKCGLNYTPNEVIELLNISKYQLEKLISSGELNIVATATSKNYKSKIRLFSILDVNDLQSKVKPKKKTEIADIEITPENLCEALYIINKSAKISRDTKQKKYQSQNYSEVRKAKNRQNTLYELKNKAMKSMVQDGFLQVKGYHIQIQEFETETNTSYLLMYVGCGFSFHSPTPCKPNDLILLGKIGVISSEKTIKTHLKFKEAISLLEKYTSQHTDQRRRTSYGKHN